MGLDIAFNRDLAIKAGIIITQERNGTDREIAAAKADPHEDTDYIAYLERESDVVHVPGTIFYVRACGKPDMVIVRANQWGVIYGPMTTWLKTNNITWTEF